VSTNPTLPYRRPLVAVDREISSVDLLLLAVRVTAPAAAQVRVVHAFPVGFEATRGWGRGALNAWGERFRGRARGRLFELLDRLPACGVDWRPEVLHGRASEVLAAHARDSAADLLAVGTHAPQGLARLLLGSVAADLLAAVSCDVLVARPDASSRALPPRPAASLDAESA
jgi:nucleotide-binding universal stress UspA family protein